MNLPIFFPTQFLFCLRVSDMNCSAQLDYTNHSTKQLDLKSFAALKM